MALMFGALYDALVSANVPLEKAQKAAEEAAGHENRLARIEADLTLLKWMTGLVIAGVLTLIIRGLF